MLILSVIVWFISFVIVPGAQCFLRKISPDLFPPETQKIKLARAESILLATSAYMILQQALDCQSYMRTQSTNLWKKLKNGCEICAKRATKATNTTTTGKKEN